MHHCVLTNAVLIVMKSITISVTSVHYVEEREQTKNFNILPNGTGSELFCYTVAHTYFMAKYGCATMLRAVEKQNIIRGIGETLE